MKTNKFMPVAITGLIITIMLFGGIVSAGDYPSKTIEVVTHAGAGGGTDVTTRMMMLRARRVLKQDMVIVNKKGGGEEKKDVNAIDWDAQNDRFKAERIFDQCLGAIADGDVDALESCLLQIESDKKVAKLSKKLEDATPDAFWKKKVKEIAATRIVDDCMSAILSGDASEIDGCILEVENEMEYLEKNV